MRHLIALVFSLMLAPVAQAQTVERTCRVKDPTGTRLNLRFKPGGEIVGNIANGETVIGAQSRLDARDREWILIYHPVSGNALGWVFREYLACGAR